MLNQLSVYGRVIGVQHKNLDNDKSVLSVTLNVPTGQPKKSDDQYPPSFLLKVEVWNKYADSLSGKISEGMYIIASGNLHAPEVYMSGDNPKATLKLGGNVNITITGQQPSNSSETTEATKTKASKSNISKNKTVEAEDLF
jgi:hypothetical protein